MFICPVCRYDKLASPPEDFSICPSCGTEFGYDDNRKSHADLRAAWIENGLSWFDQPAPIGWSGIDQLRRAGYSFAHPSWMVQAVVNFPARTVKDSTPIFPRNYQVSYQQ
jgi:hypothetical protein